MFEDILYESVVRGDTQVIDMFIRNDAACESYLIKRLIATKQFNTLYLISLADRRHSGIELVDNYHKRMLEAINKKGEIQWVLDFYREAERLEN
jgi:hypothetical protein